MSILSIFQTIQDFQKGTEVCSCDRKGAYLYLCTIESDPHVKVVCEWCLLKYSDSYCECGSGGCPGGSIASVLDLEGNETGMEEAIEKALAKEAVRQGKCEGCHKKDKSLLWCEHCDNLRCYQCLSRCPGCDGRRCEKHTPRYACGWNSRISEENKCSRSKCKDCGEWQMGLERNLTCDVCQKCCGHVRDKEPNRCAACQLFFCSQCVSEKFPEVCKRCENYTPKECPGCHENYPFLLKCESCGVSYCDDWCSHDTETHDTKAASQERIQKYKRESLRWEEEVEEKKRSELPTKVGEVKNYFYFGGLPKDLQKLLEAQKAQGFDEVGQGGSNIYNGTVEYRDHCYRYSLASMSDDFQKDVEGTLTLVS